MRLFSFLEEHAFAYELAQRLASLNYRAFLRELRSEGFFARGLSYLDVGCGTGFLRDYLKDSDYLGVDLNPRYISAARRRRGDVFQVGDALGLERIDRRFDRVICIGLVHHLDDTQGRQALAGCRARLKPAGEVFLIDALWPREKNLAGRWLRQSDNGAHVRTLVEWERLFRSELEVRSLRAFSQWPFDYVFLRAVERCAPANSVAERPA